MIENIQSAVVGLAGTAPALLFWIAVIIFAVIMLRRSGGRAERFLIAGASLKIINSLLNIPAVFIVHWLLGRGYNTDYIAMISSSYQILLNVISMAGIICLVYAFYLKSKSGEPDGEVILPQD